MSASSPFQPSQVLSWPDSLCRRARAALSVIAVAAGLVRVSPPCEASPRAGPPCVHRALLASRARRQSQVLPRPAPLAAAVVVALRPVAEGYYRYSHIFDLLTGKALFQVKWSSNRKGKGRRRSLGGGKGRFIPTHVPLCVLFAPPPRRATRLCLPHLA